MEGAKLRKYLLGKQAALGGVVTCIPTENNADGTVKTTANLIKQYQLIPFEILRREAYICYASDLAHDAPLPAEPYAIRQLDPENDLLFISSWSIASLRRNIQMSFRVTKMR